MKKKNRSLLMMILLVGVCLLGVGGFGSKASAETPAETSVEASPRHAIYRLYNPNSGEHLFTPSNYERATLVNFGWNDEGIGFYGQGYTTTIKVAYVYRIYNPNAGDHHYTAFQDEKEHLIKVGWHDDNISLVMPATLGEPVYRLYNPNAKAGAHHFTLLKSERDHLIKVGWKDEGIGFNAYSTVQ
ncbi:hypothetical protein [Enterococcus sp. DIV0170]|jgi:hypothetical protein|uniref:hypothetical protein n=1 Tax=Enterococcus sp. DIV0170 TaxID=2774642 RepID=UPI003F2331F2